MSFNFRNFRPSRRLSVLVAVGLVAAIGTVAVASAAVADEVILANTFESGSFAPWGPRGGTTLAITAESGHDSANSLSVTNRTANWNGTQTSVTDLFDGGCRLLDQRVGEAAGGYGDLDRRQVHRAGHSHRRWR